jgi:hypothetical protein
MWNVGELCSWAIVFDGHPSSSASVRLTILKDLFSQPVPLNGWCHCNSVRHQQMDWSDRTGDGGAELDENTRWIAAMTTPEHLRKHRRLMGVNVGWCIMAGAQREAVDSTALWSTLLSDLIEYLVWWKWHRSAHRGATRPRLKAQSPSYTHKEEYCPPIKAVLL